QNILEEQTGGLKEIRFSGPKDFTIPSDDLGVNFDLQATAEQAYAVGRQGGILERIAERVKSSWGTTVDVPFVVSSDREQLRAGLSEVFNELTVEPVEAGFKADDNGVSVTQSRNGQHVDEE